MGVGMLLINTITLFESKNIESLFKQTVPPKFQEITGNGFTIMQMVSVQQQSILPPLISSGIESQHLTT